jgi:hypothetical protein
MSVQITGSVFWPGSASFSEVTGFTPFGFYDTDAQFISESVASTYWAASRLGFPSTDVELCNEQFINYFEEAVTEYGAQVNAHLIQEYMITLQGSPTGSNIDGRQIRGGLGGVIKLADSYGAEVGTGGDITWHTGSIEVTAGTQVYDLNALFASASGRDIRIKKIFHYKVPASIRYFDPWGLPTSPGSYNMGFYGFGANEGGTVGGAGTSYVLRPLYEDLLRMQAIELNDQVRKSGYSFEIINNEIRLFPIPQQDYTLWFQYVFKDEADSAFVSGSGAVGDPSGFGTITDPSNVPYNNIKYSYINSVGRQWIKKYFLATCKISLGGIRGKFPNIPIPNSEVSLDGESLRSEGINEREKLIEELKEFLTKSGKRAQMEAKDETDEHMQKVLAKIPLPIYIG